MLLLRLETYPDFVLLVQDWLWNQCRCWQGVCGRWNVDSLRATLAFLAARKTLRSVHVSSNFRYASTLKCNNHCCMDWTVEPLAHIAFNFFSLFCLLSLVVPCLQHMIWWSQRPCRMVSTNNNKKEIYYLHRLHGKVGKKSNYFFFCPPPNSWSKATILRHKKEKIYYLPFDIHLGVNGVARD